MRKWKRSLSWLVVACLAMVMVSGSPAIAQGEEEEPASLSKVRLWLYPEYDDPRLLMMLDGEVVGVEIPATVRFLVPSTAVMLSAGSVGAEGIYSTVTPDRKAASVPGWDEISYQLSARTFRIEYYDVIDIGQPERKIGYQFRPLYPVTDLTVYVQQPHRSSNFSVTGSGESELIDFDGFAGGFSVNRFTYETVEPAEPLDFGISYAKEDVEPSIPAIDETEPIAPEGVNAGDVVAIGITAAVLVAMAGGAFWVYRGRVKERRPRRDRRVVAPIRRAKSKRRRRRVV